MIQQIGHAIDISHHQRTGSVPLARIASDRPTLDWKTACIVRATYGTSRDRALSEHWRDARAAKFDHVGTYHFFRPSVDPEEQALAFYSALRECTDYGDPRDIVPIIDLEDDGARRPHPAWMPGIRDTLDAVALDFSAKPMIYSTLRVWQLLGSPPELLEYPWWVADYTRAPEPLAPAGADIRMWQHRAAPYGGPHAPGGLETSGKALDQSRILKPLQTLAGDS